MEFWCKPPERKLKKRRRRGHGCDYRYMERVYSNSDSDGYIDGYGCSSDRVDNGEHHYYYRQSSNNKPELNNDKARYRYYPSHFPPPSRSASTSDNAHYVQPHSSQSVRGSFYDPGDYYDGDDPRYNVQRTTTSRVYADHRRSGHRSWQSGGRGEGEEVDEGREERGERRRSRGELNDHRSTQPCPRPRPPPPNFQPGFRTDEYFHNIAQAKGSRERREKEYVPLRKPIATPSTRYRSRLDPFDDDDEDGISRRNSYPQHYARYRNQAYPLRTYPPHPTPEPAFVQRGGGSRSSNCYHYGEDTRRRPYTRDRSNSYTPSHTYSLPPRHDDYNGEAGGLSSHRHQFHNHYSPPHQHPPTSLPSFSYFDEEGEKVTLQRRNTQKHQSQQPRRSKTYPHPRRVRFANPVAWPIHHDDDNDNNNRSNTTLHIHPSILRRSRSQHPNPEPQSEACASSSASAPSKNICGQKVDLDHVAIPLAVGIGIMTGLGLA